MRESRYIILAISFLLGVLVLLVVVLIMPSSTAYSVLNKDTMGLSRFYEKYKPILVFNYNILDKLSANYSVLIINGLDQLSKEDLNKLRLFTEKGGVIVASGSSSFLNSILSGLGFYDRVIEHHVYDIIFNRGSYELIVALCSICNSTVAVYKPLILNVNQGEPIIVTSNYSYIDLNGNGYWDLDEPIGSVIIAAKYSIGRGELYVIATQGLLTNNVIDSNDIFLDIILDKRTLMVDQSFIHANTLEYLKILRLTGELTPYIIIAVFSLSIMSMLIVNKSTEQWRENKKLSVIVLSIYIIMVLYKSLTTGNHYYMLLFVFGPLYYINKGLRRFITGFAFIVLYLYLNSNLNLVLGSLTVFFTIMVFYEYLSNAQDVEKPLTSLAGTILVYVPIYVLEPVTTIPGVIVILALTMAVFIEYIELSVFKIELIHAPISMYLGDIGIVVLKINGRGEANAYIYLDNELVKKLHIKDHAKVELSIKPKYAGLQKYIISVELKDEKGLAKLLFKPINIAVKVIPRYTSIARTARAILERYIHEVQTPVILYMSIREAKSTRSGNILVFNWTTPHRVYDVFENIVGRSIHGEYMGAREYIPGDSPRNIHWKKSISIGELIIKEYSSTPSSNVSYSTVIIADWNAPNPVELDMVIEATYSAVLSDKSPKILFLKVPGSGIYLVKGRAIDVLAALESIIKTERVEALFNYESWPRKSVDIYLDINHEVFKELLKYYEAQADVLINELEKQGVLKGSSFYTIYSKPFNLKYGVMAKYMAEHGYESALLRKMSTESIIEMWGRYETR